MSLKKMSRDDWFAQFDRSTWRLVRDGDLRIRDVIEGWRITWACRLRGHKWEESWEYYPEIGSNYEGDLCARCCRWKTAPR